MDKIDKVDKVGKVDKVSVKQSPSVGMRCV